MIKTIINNVCTMINDKRYYYSQARENKYATDCSKLILDAIRQAGLSDGGATFTGDMKRLVSTGNFKEIKYPCPLEVGDILVKHIENVDGSYTGHTVILIDKNKIAEASGKQYGLRITSFRESGWQYVLRYSGNEVKSDLPPTVKKGSKNIYVGLLQLFLNKYNGNRLEVDCDFGTKTDEAVKNFQISKSLEVDGIVGVNTWTKIYIIMVRS